MARTSPALPAQPTLGEVSEGAVEAPSEREAQTLSWSRIGRCRMRLPVAAKIALHNAGAIGGTPGSPTPPSGALESPGIRWTRISRGACAIRVTSYVL